jgi:hypothetical protein
MTEELKKGDLAKLFDDVLRYWTDTALPASHTVQVLTFTSAKGKLPSGFYGDLTGDLSIGP